MMFGLPDATLELIRRTLVGEPALAKVCVYGSRAMGSYRPGSDIDLAIWLKSGETADIAARLQGQLEALPTPYIFDVTDYAQVSNPELRAHIDLVGKPIFPV